MIAMLLRNFKETTRDCNLRPQCKVVARVLYRDLSQLTVFVIFLFIVNQHSNEVTWLCKTPVKSFKADYFTADYISKLVLALWLVNNTQKFVWSPNS